VPPAPNDLRRNATRVTAFPFFDTVDTSAATTSPNDPDCFGNGPTVWYRIIPPTDGTIVIDTFGSDYDTTLSAYVRSGLTLVREACNDDTDGLQSQIEVQGRQGVPVLVMVGAFASGPGGLLNITIQAATDIDFDGVPDHRDNCLFDFNPDQGDLDEDGLGNACDDTPFHELVLLRARGVRAEVDAPGTTQVQVNLRIRNVLPWDEPVFVDAFAIAGVPEGCEVGPASGGPGVIPANATVNSSITLDVTCVAGTPIGRYQLSLIVFADPFGGIDANPSNNFANATARLRVF
jgi:hypothetical protein